MFSIINTTNLQYRQNQWFGGRTKIWVFPWKYEGLWKPVGDNKKETLPECVELQLFLKKHRCWRSKTKIRHSKNAYIYCRFWRMLMITRVEDRWRSSKMWILTGTCDKNEPPMDPNKDGVLSKVDFFGGHSNILRSAESRMWTALQTCDKNEGRQREAKPGYTNELVRFTARTPWFVPHCLKNVRNN